jgi:hypothetical protein
VSLAGPAPLHLLDGVRFEPGEPLRETRRRRADGVGRDELGDQPELLRVGDVPVQRLIAGPARQRNLTWVTHNVRKFARGAGLRCVDWREQSGRTL